MQSGLRVGNPIAVVTDWENAGIDEKALFRQDVEGPKGLLGNGETRGPVCGDRFLDE